MTKPFFGSTKIVAGLVCVRSLAILMDAFHLFSALLCRTAFTMVSSLSGAGTNRKDTSFSQPRT